MYSQSYEKHLYLNPSYEIISQGEITEYDMKEGGYNIIKQFGLLPDSEIERLSHMTKKSRTIEIGKLQRRTEGLSKLMNNGFEECRRWFFYANDIQDKDVLSIKKDAIFTMKKCDNVQKGNILFVEKNEYRDFIVLDRKEIYIGKHTHVKGISDNLVKLHEDFILDIIREHIRNISKKSEAKQIEFLKEVMHYYRNRELEIEYYREFNRDSMYRLNQRLLDDALGITFTEDINMIDIQYNYMNVLVPLIRTI